MITLLSFLTSISSFRRCTSQSSSHSCPIDISDELLSFGMMCTFLAEFDTPVIGSVPAFVACNVVLSGNATVGPSSSMMLSRTLIS